MNNRLIPAALCVAFSLLLFNCVTAEEPLNNPPSTPYRRGVNIAGAEFGEVPGVLNKNYTYNNEATFKYFGEKGFNVLRVPISWERMQPALSGVLDADNLRELKKNIAWAKAHESSVIIDVHNYCRYGLKTGGKAVSFIIDTVHDGQVPVKTADLADLWVRLSNEFKDDAGVYGYGLMNEPHDLGTADWKGISNTVVKAIRDNGDKKLILVGGVHWSNASGWKKNNGPISWIDDPEKNFLYEAHCYFDSDNSGSYKKSYDKELGANPNLANIGSERVKGFVEWCRKNNVRGFLGEFAIPGNDARWNEVLENFMQALDQAGFGATYWAAGIFWGEYTLSLQPTDKYTADRSQMEVMLRHLAPVQAAHAQTSGGGAQK